MRVICIYGLKASTMPFDTTNPASLSDELYEGVIYTVIGQKEYHGELCYFLAEKRRTAAYWYGSFAPLSEIDETTFERNFKKELV